MANNFFLTSKLKKKNEELYVVEDEEGKKVNQKKEIAPYVSKVEEIKDKVTFMDVAKNRASNSTKTNSTNKSSSSNDRTWFSSGVFSDGYQIGDVTKTILGTTLDVSVGAAKGIARIGEGLIDLGSYGVAGVADLLGNDDYADKVREKAKVNKVDNAIAPLETIIDPYSVIGEKGDSVTEGLGYVAAIMATGGLGASAGLGTLGTTALTTGLTGLSSMGSGMSEAYQAGATDEEALKYGIIAGVAEAGSELIFGGLGKAVNAVGLSKGLSSLDDALAKKISSKITSTLGKNLAEYTVKAGAEGVEEVISGITQGIGKKMTYMSDEDLVKILQDENLLEQFVVGTVTSSIAQAPGLVKTTSAGRDFVSGYTQNEQKVINAEVESRVNEQEQAIGRELTNKEISKIKEQVETDFQKGYVSTDTIENTLGKKLSTEEETAIENQLNSLLEQSKMEIDPNLQTQISEQMKVLENQLNASKSLDFSKDSYIQKSYQERELRKQKFTTNETEVSDNQNINDFYKSVEEANVNNTTKVHDFTSFVANIMKDKGIKARAVNYDTLVREGKLYQDTDGKYKFIKDGVKTDQVANINGFKENGVLNINMESTKVFESTVGHELGEFIKSSDVNAYNEIKQIAIELGKVDGTYNEEALSKYGETYQDLTDDVTDEYVNDKLGELFTNDNFVNEISKKPSLLQKIISEVKHLVKMATTGSAEARKLISLQHKLENKFKEVYKNTDLTQQASTDTKYSVSDNQGRELSEEQQEYFKDSKVRDENGNLLTMYHGTRSDFNVFDMNRAGQNYEGGWSALGKGFYFTPDIEVAKDFSTAAVEGKQTQVKEVFLNITNPFYIGENYSDKLSQLKEKYNIDNTTLNKGYRLLDFLSENGYNSAEVLQELGYDGVIDKYNNKIEEAVVFNSNQIKNVDNTKPTSNPDIRYSLSEDGKMVDNKGNEVKLEATETGTHGTLMAIHNLSESKLDGILELGGFPVPSIAIIDTNNSYTSFGDVSVLFDKNTIDPTNEQNKVYGSDVYSPRFPRTVNKINEAGAKEVAKTLKMSPYEFESIYGEQPIEDVVQKLIRDDIVIDKYLESKGIKVEPVYKQYKAENSGIPEKYVVDFLNNHEELKNNDIVLRNLNYDEYSNEIKQMLIDSLVEQGVTLEDAQELYSDFGKTDITKFLLDVKGYKKLGDSKNTIDEYATKQEKIKHIDLYSEEYQNFIKDIISPAFEGKYIRNEKDWYTPSGNSRSFNQLYDEYNLDNVVKRMKGKIRGEEGYFYGAGNIRSQITPQFKSIAEIKDNTGKLVSAAQMERVKVEINAELSNLSEMAGKYGGHSYDSYEYALNEIAGLKKITFDNAKQILYEYGFKDFPDRLVNQSIEFLERLKNAPTEYFEAKPQRAVGFDEIQAIVVRNDIGKQLKQKLMDLGLNVIEYDPNIEGDRQAKINEFDELKFSLSAENEIAPVKNPNLTYAEDVKLQVEEAIAPLQEQIETLTEQLNTVASNIEQVQEVAPVAPKTVVNEKGVQISVGDTIRTFNNSVYEVTDITTDSGITRASLKSDTYKTAIGINAIAENLTNPALNHVSTRTENAALENAAPVEQQGQEAANSITDEQAPTFEDTVDEIMWNETFETGETTGNKVESPFDSRDIDEVGNRKIKAYQYENPEVKPYFQQEAQNMIYDLDNTIKGERIATHDQEGYITGWNGITRQTTEAIAYLKDNYGYSYDQIRQGLNKIIEDDGLENNAVSKRIEFMLDERLREGYTTSDGIPIPPNQEYINFLSEKQITQYNKEAFNALTDEDVPLEITPEPRESATINQNTQSEQTIPMKKKPAQNQNTDVEKAKQRSWAKTSTESEAIKGKILLTDLDAEKIQYVPISNKETLSKANAKLDNLGYEKALEHFNSRINSGEIPKLVDITLGQRLMQEALAKGDKATAIEILQDITMLGTEVGQITQSLSIIQRLTPAGQLRMLDKVVQRGKLRGDKAFEGLELTDDMKNRIMECYNEDGQTYNQDKLNEVMEQIKQELANQMPVTKMDQANAWRYFAMLGNPKTHTRNIVSTAANYATIQVKNMVARTMEDVAPMFGYDINRTKTWKQSSQPVIDFAEKTTLEMKDIISGENQLGIKAELKAKRKIFKSEFMNKLTNGNSDLMSREDSWFSRPTFKKSLQEFLTANGIETQEDIQNNPELIEKGKAYALEQSQIATFRQYSWLASKISEIERKNTATQIAIGSVLPFKKTPINIAKAGLSYSPIGAFKALTYDIAQVKQGKMEASTAIDHIAQGATGTALTLIGYMLAQMGFLNGAGDDDKEGKYDSQLGKQGYSLNIGDTTYSLSWLSPLAMPLLVGANAYEKLVEKDEWNADVVMDTLAQTLDPLSEMSFLSSLDDVMSSYDSGIMKWASIGQTAIQNYATQFIPTLSSQIAATLDDTKRTTKVAGDSTFKQGDELYNQLIYKIPGLRQTLEPTLDIWGNEVKQSENLLQRAFENFISPYTRKENIATEIDEELKDLYAQTGDTGILPSIPYNYVNYDGEKYNMSAEEYTDYKKTYGQTANDLLEDLFRTTTYKNATSEDRADMVNKVYDYARDEAKLEYLAKENVEYTNAKKDGEEYYRENLIKGAIENDMTPDEYELYVDDPEEYSFLKEKDYSYRRKYFDTNDSLKKIEKSFEDQKEGVEDDDELDALYSEKKVNIVDSIINSGLEDTEKASLYKKYYNSDTVDTIVKSAISVDDYLTYETKEFKADKNEKGNSIPGSRKDKVINYVNTLDMSIAQKAILIKSTNTFKFNDYNTQIVEYVGSLDIDYEDMVKILEDLDMTVKGDVVYWE